MWADIDAYPGIELEKEYKDFEYPIEQIKETGSYLVNGMVYGWEFSYTPYDRTRGVKEYLEVTPIHPIEYVKNKVEYSSPWIEDGLFRCWCQYERTDHQIQDYYRWSSISNPVICGKGYGDFKKGFEGIKDAADDALKNAVREYYRNKIKNKPKEIRGRVLIKDAPMLGVDAGRYVFNLDFFLECGRIIEYKVF